MAKDHRKTLVQRSQLAELVSSSAADCLARRTSYPQGRDPGGTESEGRDPWRAADMAAADPNPHCNVAIRFPRHDGREDFRQRPSGDRTCRAANGTTPEKGARRGRCRIRSACRQAVYRIRDRSCVSSTLWRQHPRHSGHYRNRYRGRSTYDYGRKTRTLSDSCALPPRAARTF